MAVFKVATWNVNSLRVRLQHVLDWLQVTQPDVLGLQELKMPTEDFPIEAFQQIGYDVVVNGQKTYNGVAVIYKKQHVYDGSNTRLFFETFDDPQKRVLAMTVNDVRILNLYVPNGESITSEKYQYKLTWLSHLDSFLKNEIRDHAKMVIMGDFNIAPSTLDVYDPSKWEGQVLCTEPERSAFQNILSLGFNDCFRTLAPTEVGYSWWDYRMNAFKRRLGLRIDLILASQSLIQSCEKCFIDQGPRALERPSDHAPVIAHFNI